MHVCKKSSHKPVTIKFIQAVSDHQSNSELELVPTKNFHPNSHILQNLNFPFQNKLFPFPTSGHP